MILHQRLRLIYLLFLRPVLKLLRQRASLCMMVLRGVIRCCVLEVCPYVSSCVVGVHAYHGLYQKLGFALLGLTIILTRASQKPLLLASIWGLPRGRGWRGSGFITLLSSSRGGRRRAALPPERAQVKTGGPPPIRSDLHPNGIPGLAGRDAIRVDKANAVYAFCVSTCLY